MRIIVSKEMWKLPKKKEIKKANSVPVPSSAERRNMFEQGVDRDKQQEILRQRRSRDTVARPLSAPSTPSAASSLKLGSLLGKDNHDECKKKELLLKQELEKYKRMAERQQEMMKEMQQAMNQQKTVIQRLQMQMQQSQQMSMSAAKAAPPQPRPTAPTMNIPALARTKEESSSSSDSSSEDEVRGELARILLQQLTAGASGEGEATGLEHRRMAMARRMRRDS